jgi:hypothetical protein
MKFGESVAGIVAFFLAPNELALATLIESALDLRVAELFIMSKKLTFPENGLTVLPVTALRTGLGRIKRDRILPPAFGRQSHVAKHLLIPVVPSDVIFMVAFETAVGFEIVRSVSILDLVHLKQHIRAHTVLLRLLVASFDVFAGGLPTALVEKSFETFTRIGIFETFQIFEITPA